jgi:hypothetical protein
MSFADKSETTHQDFEAGEVMDEAIASNEKLPFFTRRRFQIITCASMLLAIICLCVVVPAVVITNKNKSSLSSSDSVYFGEVWITLGPKIVGEFGDQQLGESIALSEDGSIMAVGSNFHSANSGILNVYKVSPVRGFVGIHMSNTFSYRRLYLVRRISVASAWPDNLGNRP